MTEIYFFNKAKPFPFCTYNQNMNSTFTTSTIREE